ncbi:pantoate--beta-alanine ligase [candidate division WOR-3 bacterium]|nr:pantoate--beta-alanine ligase [candidate division WOR-3 bacterium]
MKIFRTIEEQQNYSKNEKCENIKIALVPTMGFLHEGHLSLIDKAKEHADKIIVSIFVNPTQFGEGEDYKDYPRDERKDLEVLREKNVDAVFIPEVSEMYPEGFRTFCEVGELSNKYCGESRPAHFRGVTTVVLKLFNITKPDIAVFGEKDYQQYIIIKKMTEDLNLPIEIIPSPIIREGDGLALSSRNIYLEKEERIEATVIYESLVMARKMIDEGEYEVNLLKGKMNELIKSKKHARIDYIEFVDSRTLEKVEKVENPTRILVGVWIGKARLIDNMEIKP